jgi:hypothetical protein
MNNNPIPIQVKKFWKELEEEERGYGDHIVSS